VLGPARNPAGILGRRKPLRNRSRGPRFPRSEPLRYTAVTSQEMVDAAGVCRGSPDARRRHQPTTSDARLRSAGDTGRAPWLWWLRDLTTLLRVT
jgi:hypothetical protein